MKRGLIVSTALGALAVASIAAAQEAPKASIFNRAVPAPRHALELGVGTGYSQGMGQLQAGQRILDTAGAGAQAEVDIGYRASPHFMVGLYGTGASFTPGGSLSSGTMVRSASAGVQANYHFRPYQGLDPWIGLGAGWRGHWIAPTVGTVISRQGLELARATVGLDYRISPEIAIGPMIGADASLLMTERGPNSDTFAPIQGRRVSTFVFAGIQGHFDMLGEAVNRPVAGVAGR